MKTSHFPTLKNERTSEGKNGTSESLCHLSLPLFLSFLLSLWDGGDEADDDVGSDAAAAAADSAADLIVELRTALLCRCQRSGQVTLSETANERGSERLLFFALFCPSDH